MLQRATHTLNVAIAESGSIGFIQQTIPYVYAFAVGTAPALDSRMPLGRIVTVAVADGTRPSHAPDDLFARRVPGFPAVTGPVHVTGVRRGDNLEIELIALESNDPGSVGQLLATIGVASSDPGRGADSVQTTLPVGGIVRMTARHPGGLIQFGPVVSRRNRNGALCEEPMAARMMVRCTVIQSHGV